jgi:hypothetical protein
MRPDVFSNSKWYTRVAAVALNLGCGAAAISNERHEIRLSIVAPQRANGRGHGSRQCIVFQAQLSQTGQLAGLYRWDHAHQFIAVEVQVPQIGGVAIAGGNGTRQGIFGKIEYLQSGNVKDASRYRPGKHVHGEIHKAQVLKWLKGVANTAFELSTIHFQYFLSRRQKVSAMWLCNRHSMARDQNTYQDWTVGQSAVVACPSENCRPCANRAVRPSRQSATRVCR